MNALALAIFAVVLAVTLGITYWASKRTSTATEFWAAGRGISGGQNGFAIAGDYMSASSFLGFAGLIFFFGLDGFIGLVAALVAFVPVLFLLAERMRNAGKFTMADVLAFRMKERPTRMAAALGTLSVAFFYLLAQMVGAGVVIQALAGIDFAWSVVLTGTFMVVYVIFGGMLATTWVQIIKAGLLMACGVVITVLVLAKTGFNLFDRAIAQHEAGSGFLKPGLMHADTINGISFGLAFLLGTAGLPHILIRFFTVPDARAARRSVGWAVLLIGLFYVMIMIIGVGARAILGSGAEEASAGGNLAIPLLVEELGGGAGTLGGDIFLAYFRPTSRRRRSPAQARSSVHCRLCRGRRPGLPRRRWTVTGLSHHPRATATAAVATALVPDERVSPAPRSQTATVRSRGLSTRTSCTFVRSGKRS